MTAAAAITFILLTGIGTAFADTEVTTDTARNKTGRVAYVERHSVRFADKEDVKEATTEFKRESGEVFAQVHLNFFRSLSAPNFTFEDLRDGSSHGVEFDGQKYVLWRKAKDKKRETVEYPAGKFASDELVTCSQGLHYYLTKNFNTLKLKKDITLKLLTPDKLDYFTFVLSVEKEDDRFYHLEMKPKSLVLRAVVSPIRMTYRKADARIVQFSGLSNVPDDTGNSQDVIISYEPQ